MFKKRERPAGCTCQRDAHEFQRYVWEEIRHRESSKGRGIIRVLTREIDKDKDGYYILPPDVKAAIARGDAPKEAPPEPPPLCRLCEALAEANRPKRKIEIHGPEEGADFGNFLHGTGQYAPGGPRDLRRR